MGSPPVFAERSGGTPQAPTLLTTPPPRRSPAASPPFASKIGAGRIQAVLLGAAGVGKTALAQRLLGQDSRCSSSLAPAPMSPAVAAKCSAAPPPTVGVDFATRSVALDGGPPVRLHLWDTSGQERFRELGETYLCELEAHDTIILVYSSTDAASLEEVCLQARRALRLTKSKPQLALVATKADLEPREVSAEEGRARAEELGASAFVEVSCPAMAARAASFMPAEPEYLATRQAIEAQLLRPLLRRCREHAPPPGTMTGFTPSRIGATGAGATPGSRPPSTDRRRQAGGGKTPPRTRAPQAPQAAAKAPFACGALRRCLRLVA